MSAPCTVIIGATELLESLRASAGAVGEVLTFGDKEPLQALAAITARSPSVIALERLFAATSRGAALINRIKADPALAGAEIRVLSTDGTYRVSPRRAPASHPPSSAAAEPEPAPAAHVSAQNLDYRGTRRAPRFRMTDGTEAQLDGAIATVIDLSTYGAQILCPTPLKPLQQVRMVLADALGVVKCNASVAWAFFEIPKGVSRYRAGVEFKNAEGKDVTAFCRRHEVRPA